MHRKDAGALHRSDRQHFLVTAASIVSMVKAEEKVGTTVPLEFRAHAIVPIEECRGHITFEN